jgi:uncharacterized Fe-S cluster-containing protein
MKIQFCNNEFLIQVLDMFHEQCFIKSLPDCVCSSRLFSLQVKKKHLCYAGAAGMLLPINGKFTMGKLKSSLLS